MYQEVVLPGLPVPSHPCPGCGQPVPRGHAGLLPRPSQEKTVKKVREGKIDPLQPSSHVKHLGVCKFPRAHPSLLLACDTEDEMMDLLGELGIDPAQVAGPTPNTPPNNPG